MTRVSIFLLLFIFASCATAVSIPVHIEGSGQLSSKERVCIDDKLTFYSHSGLRTLPMAIGRLGVVNDSTCYVDQHSLSVHVQQVWIADLDDAALPGVLRSLPEPIELSVDNGLLTFRPNGLDLKRWITDKSHRESLPAEHRYRVMLEGGWTSKQLLWSELVVLLSKPDNYFGWPREGLQSASIIRSEHSLAPVVFVLLVGALGAAETAQNVSSGAPSSGRSKQGRENVSSSSWSQPESQIEDSPYWTARPCGEGKWSKLAQPEP